MNSLLSFLLRSGGGILRESAELFVGQQLARAAAAKVRRMVVFYGLLALFALSALGFFYVLLYRWLSLQLDELSAAAILCGSNLVLIGLMLASRAITRSRAPQRPVSPIASLLKSHAESLGAGGLDFDKGMELGAHLNRRIRKAAPQIALGAVVVGLIIGLRPQLLDIFRRRDPPPGK